MQSDNRPNVVFIFADQMRVQATGFGGDPNVRTPYLDSLSKEAVEFTTAVTNCPICTPYRASLLSGQYPLTHGLFLNDLMLPDNGNSIAQVYKRNGYDTAYIGKWHLDGHGRSGVIPKERRQGFDYWKVLECTHDYNKSFYYNNDNESLSQWEGYDTYAQGKDAKDYLISRKDNDKPFVLFVSFGTPHDPYDTAPPELKELYPPDKLILRKNISPLFENLARKELQGYYAHITAIDKTVELINQALAKAGKLENTIFVFTADHGDCIESQWVSLNLSERGPRKQIPYDESILVPFLIRYPSLMKNSGKNAGKISTPIGAPDIMPTLLELSGIAIPGTVEGISLANVLTDNKNKFERDAVLIASYQPFADNRTERGGRPYRGVRTARYTYVRDLNGPWLLFDNESDPYQMKNLVNKNSHSAIQKELEEKLFSILKEQNDGFERPEVLLKRFGYKVNEGGEIPYTW